MSKLSVVERNALPQSDFAVRGRKFPISDRNHARAALLMVGRAKKLSSEQRMAVIRKAHAKLAHT